MIVCAKCYETVEQAEIDKALDEGVGYIHKCGRVFFKPRGQNLWEKHYDEAKHEGSEVTG